MACSAWAAAKVCGVCGADCTPVLMADPVSGPGGGLPHRLARSGGAHSSRARFVTWRASAVVVRIFWWPSVRRSSGSAYQVQAGCGPLQVQEVLERQSRPPILWPVLARAGALLGGSRTRPLPLDIRAATLGQLQFEGLLESQITVCPLCTVAEAILVPFLAPRPGPKRCNGKWHCLPRLITPRLIIREWRCLNAEYSFPNTAPKRCLRSDHSVLQPSCMRWLH